MDRTLLGTVFVVLITIRFANGSIPGTFFWKPRMAIDLSLPKTEHPQPVRAPTKQNIWQGYVVLVEPYKAGLTVVAIATMLNDAKPHPHLDYRRASYYTNVYRWTLRYLSMIPIWLSGGTNGGHYADTHKVWRRRFFYMDYKVPKWLREWIPFVTAKDWKNEDVYFERFKKYAEPSFGKHYRYPSKRFNNFASNRIKETIENMNMSNLSLPQKFRSESYYRWTKPLWYWEQGRVP